MIGHKYTPTVGHTGSYAFGDHVRRNLGATVVELGIPPALAVGSVNLDFNGNEDKIVIGTGKISSSSVNSKGDVVFKIGTDSVTVKKIDGEDISDGKKITITDDDGETSYTYFSEKIVSADGKVTLQSNFKGSSFTADENISEIDASKVTKKFAITGNDKANTIVGGKGANLIDGGNGNDLLFGGKGNDTFVISEGNDTIADYLSGSNKISLGSAQIKNYSVDDGDVIFSFEGGNSLTIQDAAGEKITLVENGKSVVNVYAADGIFNTAKTAVTLAADSQIFSAANYSKLTTINGSAVTDEVEIIGNGNANKIYAGDFDSTLNGGGGNDTLWGGNGSDTFIYDSGNGKDVIYDFGAEDMLQIGAEFTASLKNNSVAFKVGTTAGAITLKNFSGTEFVANGDTYQLSGSTFTKK